MPSEQTIEPPADTAPVERIVMLRDTVQAAVDIANENAVLQQTVNEQSQIIAALVLDHGGTISGETWDTVHAIMQFCPYSKRSCRNGIVIELSE